MNHYEKEFLKNIEEKTNREKTSIIIKFSISPYRKKVKQPQEPIKRSKYAQSLWDEGAGWDEQKADRTGAS